MWDVVVVGSGPGGSAAAAVCAKGGLRTLLLERRKLPRDKVCSGVLFGDTAQHLTRETFGDIPDNVLIPPYYLKGQIVYVEGAEPGVIAQRMPVAWRKDLDYWMTRRAADQGAEVLDSARVLGISQLEGSCSITIQKEGKQEKLSARFVVGADGAKSAVRYSLFPGLEVPYNQEIRECYQGAFPLDKDYIHTFYDPVRKYWFIINHKGLYFLLEVAGKLGETKRLRDHVVKPFLARYYGFDPAEQPVWVDGTVEAKLYEQLISGGFVPARDNVLLVGDAAGFQLPTGEGIGTALKSGVLAGNSILQATRENKKASDIYLSEARVIVELIKTLHDLAKKSRFTPTDNPQDTVSGIVEMMERSVGVIP